MQYLVAELLFAFFAVIGFFNFGFFNVCVDNVAAAGALEAGGLHFRVDIATPDDDAGDLYHSVEVGVVEASEYLVVLAVEVDESC